MAAEAAAPEASAATAARSTPRRRQQVRPAPPARQGGAQRRSTGRSRAPSLNIGSGGDRTSYQAVILGEFVAAILLVAATPFAKKETAGVSPYVGADLLQLVALTLTFFILALISGANRGAGRFAAWFGALILLTVGLAEAARLAKLLNVFGLQSPPPAGASTGQEAGGGPIIPGAT
jgi:hypothetical protein